MVVSTENFGDFKGFPVLNAFQETLILDTVCISETMDQCVCITWSLDNVTT